MVFPCINYTTASLCLVLLFQLDSMDHRKRSKPTKARLLNPEIACCGNDVNDVVRNCTKSKPRPTGYTV